MTKIFNSAIIFWTAARLKRLKELKVLELK